MDLEILLDHTTTTLCKLNRDQITEVCKYLSCFEEGENVTWAKRTLIRTVKTKLDDIEQNTELEKATQVIQKLLIFMGNMTEDCGGQAQSPAALWKWRRNMLNCSSLAEFWKKN